MASSLNQSKELNETLGLFVTPNLERQAILYFNTELSDEDFFDFNMSILRKAKLESSDDFFSFNFNGYHLTSLPKIHLKLLKSFLAKGRLE